MLVTRKNLGEVISQLGTGTYAVDTETSGLRAYHGDKLFSLIICNGTTSWYFNFQQYPELDGYKNNEWVLPRATAFAELAGFFNNPENILYLQNAKFDLAMLAKEGVVVRGKVYDTEVLGRLLYNRNIKYDLRTMVKAIGLEKSGEVDDYIATNKLFTWVKSPGKDKRAKWPHFDRVPFAIISRYGEKDGEITWKLGEYQRQELSKLSATLTTSRLSQSLLSLVETEALLTKTCFAMEQKGIRIDRGYCQRAYEYETDLAEKAAAEFSHLAGVEFKDSRIVLAKAFTAAGEKYPVTEKGNPSFTDEVLEGFTSPLAQLLRNHRGAAKRANTYFANFLYFADAQDRIHPNMRQAGTDTGRFSFSDPNLQNVPKDDEGEFPIRKAFVPSEGHFFAMLDYDQVEFRVMLDYAGEMGVIRRIIDEGLDVHQATADTMGVTRQQAKTLNFMLIYGGGAQKLATSLGVSLKEAQDLKEQYFGKLPKVSSFIRNVMERANTRGYVFNAAGRVCYFPPMMNPRTGKLDRFAYKAPNHLIQGLCADIIKKAMNQVAAYLKDERSRMLLTVHDEILLEVVFDECYLLKPIKKIMEKSYAYRHLPLSCGLDISFTSWSDKRSVPSQSTQENLELALLKAL